MKNITLLSPAIDEVKAPEDSRMSVNVADDVEVGLGHAGGLSICGFESA
jgi:hypothetical protein